MGKKKRTNLIAPRFLIAKYAPDLRRMEPRNIGVVVWSQSGIAARFLGESPDGSLSIPRQAGVQSANAYRQWVSYWRGKLDRGYIKKKDGSRVGAETPEFLDELRRKSKRQYMLVDGGFFTESLDKSEVGDAVDELFTELVESPASAKTVDSEEHKAAARTLRRSARRVIEESGLSKRDDFWSGFDWLCPVGDRKQPFHFDYALHTTQPSFVIEDLPLWRRHHVYSTAFRFQAMRAAYSLPKTHCTAFVYLTEEDMGDEGYTNAMKLIDDIGSVINVSDVDRAAAELLRLVA